MDLLIILTLLTTICNFTLGLLVFLNNPSRWLNRAFSIFAFFMGFWVFTNLMMGLLPNIFWLKSSYAFGLFTVTGAAPWILYLCEEKFNKRKILFFLIPALLLFAISYYDGLMVKDVTRIYLGGYEGKTGPAFPFYSLFILGGSLYLLSKIFLSYRKADRVKKIQLSYVLIGLAITLIISGVASLILPLFGVLKFTHLDSPSLSVFLIFTAYAILKHHLMEIRLIATEILVGFLALVLLVELFTAKQVPDIILKSGIFVLFSYLGWSLIKSVTEEVKKREELEFLTSKLEKTNLELKENEKELKGLTTNLERRVQERTKELKEKIKELERFYRVTVGRELKMVELKKEIERLKGERQEKDK